MNYDTKRCMCSYCTMSGLVSRPQSMSSSGTSRILNVCVLSLQMINQSISYFMFLLQVRDNIGSDEASNNMWWLCRSVTSHTAASNTSFHYSSLEYR